MKTRPSKLLLRIFKWFCRPDLHPYVEGDLLELHQERNSKIANWLLLLDIIKLFRPDIIRSFRPFTLVSSSLMKNNVKVGLRNINRNRGYTAINVFGLSIGLSISFIVLLFTVDELSYDKFHSDADRIYRVTKSYNNGDKIVETVPFRSYLLDQMRAEIAGIEEISTLKPLEGQHYITFDDRKFTESKISFADSNFFGFFSFELSEGNANRALKDPYTIVISESKAEAYFGSDSPVGKVLSINNIYDDKGFDVTVTGVFKDMPKNSHFHFDLLISMTTGELEYKNIELFSFPLKYGYLKTAQNQKIEQISSLIPAIEDKYAPDFYRTYDMHLQPQALLDIHLKSNMDDEYENNGSEFRLFLFIGIAAVVLIIAIFNYINLITARSIEKVKEVGVRKILGSSKNQLITQFMVESILISQLSLLVAYLVTTVTLPIFNQYVDKDLSIIFTSKVTIYFVLIAFLTGIIAGIYPALILSKGDLVKPSVDETNTFRKVLLVLQFGMASLLIVSTIVILGQWNLLRNQTFSFNSEEIVNIDVSSLKIRDNYHLIKYELMKNSNIKLVTGSDKKYISPLSSFNGLTVPGKDGFVDMYYAMVDADFFQMYSKKMVSGRNFRANSTDSLGAIIVNESAAKLIGVDPEEIIGLPVEVYDSYNPTVIGVVEDFQYQSFQYSKVPMYFQLFYTKEVIDQLQVISVKINTSDLSESIRQIEIVFNQIDKDASFNYSFLDRDIEFAYRQEKKFSEIFIIITVLSIIIACLGMFGITTASTQQRKRELGIRKVLGASLFQIAFIINKNFLILVLLANVISFPIAYLLNDYWLQNFAHRVEVGPLTFLVTLLISIAVTLVGSCYWSVKAALSNPVDAIQPTN